ncbi:MAG: hypothetical protein R3D59_09925 [Paracoccaceae bacterium]
MGSINAVSETLTAAIPLVLAGLGLGLGFGPGCSTSVRGQLLMGGMAAVVFAFSFPGLPFPCVLLALVAGALVKASVLAGIAGLLKATAPARMR